MSLKHGTLLRGFMQLELSTPKGLVSLSFYNGETPHKQFLSSDLPVSIPDSNPNTCISMKLLQDYHKLISSLIFHFFSVIARPYPYDSFITSDLQHWLCWGSDLEPNYWSISFISSLSLKTAIAALARLSETAHFEHITEGETEQKAILHHSLIRRGQTVLGEMSKQLYNLFQGYRWVRFRPARKQLLRNWGLYLKQMEAAGKNRGQVAAWKTGSLWHTGKAEGRWPYGPCCYG